MIDYRIDMVRVIGKSAFYEASKEELRTLLALIELGGRAEGIDALASAAKISTARCKAALAFWEESEVIFEGSDRPLIIEEFEQRLVRAEIDEVASVRVADSIREEQLASMINECAEMMKQACLSNTDVKNITALHTQYDLSPEYIVMLAAHMHSKGKLTTRRLCDEAIRLSGKGVDSFDALEAYLAEIESRASYEWEFRRALGIFGGALSPSQEKYFKKWAEEYQYSVAIVREAYDVAVLNTSSGKGDLRYMDSVLSAWHEAGCKTVGECKEFSEREKLKRQAQPTGADKKKKSTPPTPRYGNFDINEAFNNAVARSFGGCEDKEGEVE